MKTLLQQTVIVLIATVFLCQLSAGQDRAENSDGPRAKTEPLAPGSGVLTPVVNADAPSLAVLPPAVPSDADEETGLLAELASDRIAQEVALTGKVQLVDRTAIEAVLDELKLSKQQIQPVLSYDALCRLKVERTQGELAARLHIVDLSSGNVIEEVHLPWPLSEEHVGAIRRLLNKVLPQVGRYQPGRRRIRFLGVQDVRDHIRVRPLAEKLQLVFEESLAASDELLLVRHLEAASTRDESLFLLMGLSALPGGRSFVPQADAAIELAVREVDAIGHSLEDVGIELGLRLNTGKDASNTITVAGRVGDSEQLVEQLWRQFTRELTQLSSVDIRETLQSMALRRAQAEAETRAISSLAVGQSPPSAETLDRWQAHAETALKLDPAFDRGMYELIDVTRHRIVQPLPVGVNDKHAIDVLKLTADYLQRFEQPPQDASSVQVFASMAVNGTQLRSLRFQYRPAPGGDDLHGAVAAVQQIVEATLGRNVRSASSATVGLFAVAGRGMRLTGVPEPERRVWIERMLRLGAEQSLQLVELDGSIGPDSNYRMWRQQYQSFVCQFLVTAVQLACEEGWEDLADDLLTELKPLLDTSNRIHENYFTWLRQGLSQPGFESRKLAFDQWLDDLRKQPAVDFLQIDWPTLAPLPPTSPLITSSFRTTIDGVETVSPVAIVNQRLFVLLGDRIDGTWSAFCDHSSSRNPVRFGWLPVQSDGQPLADRTAKAAIQQIPDPPCGEIEGVYCSRVVGDRVIFATRHKGIVVFDSASNEWAHFGTESGLPANSVYRIWPVDEQTLFCTGLQIGGPARSISEMIRTVVHFTFDLRTGESRVMSRDDLINRGSTRSLDAVLGLIWKHDDEWRGFGPTGVWHDLLASHRREQNAGSREITSTAAGDSLPSLHFAEQVTAHGWKHRHTGYRDGKHDGVVINGRRFVSNSFRLAELDEAGGIDRAWYSRNRVRPTDFLNLFLSPWPDTVFQMPADSPYHGEFIIACGQTIVCLSDRSRVAMLYEPETDVWSGPVVLADQPAYALATDKGFWTAGSTLQFVPLLQLKAAAKSSDRVISTADFRARLAATEQQLSVLEKAQVAYTARRFADCAALLSQHLADHPDDPVALHLAGLAYGPLGLNDSEQASLHFRRLADLQDNPSASLTGLVNLMELHRRNGDIAEAASVGQELLHQYPKLKNSLVRQTAERMIQSDRLQRLRASASLGN